MVTLPPNATLAALALVLGVLIGAGGTYYFTSSSQPSGSDVATIGEMEGQGVLERIRSIAPRDTSGQEEADVEIRYRSKRDTVRDSVYVPIPSGLPQTPAISSKEPIEVTSDRVTWTLFNKGRWKQKVYSVPQDRWEWGAYALAERSYTVPEFQLEQRLGLGLTLVHRPQWASQLDLSVEATTALRWEPRVGVRIRYHF
jgi:hypothetical protein